MKADGAVVWLCTDKGLSSFNGNEWITYTTGEKGGTLIQTRDGKSTSRPASTGIAHNYVIGVDFQGDELWVATSHGLSRGTRIK